MDSRRGNILVTGWSATMNEYINNTENTKHSLGLGEYCRNHTFLQTHIQTVTNQNETHKSIRLRHCAHL